jgi:twitching motility protein PilT
MLCDVNFSNIYLGEKAFLGGIPGSHDPVPADSTHADELNTLREECRKSAAAESAMVGPDESPEDFPVTVNGIVYRASILDSLTERVFILRRQPKTIRDLSELGMHELYQERLLTPQLTGLVLFAGAFSQGKTTTASSVLQARVRNNGGVAIAIEDPPEQPLQGEHGKGVIYQHWVRRGRFAAACRQAARWAPSAIFLSEIRDGNTAAEALRAAINGRLVLATVHADSIESAVERIYSLAASSGGSADDWASLLASGLTAVMHQSLDEGDKSLRAEMLWLGDESDTSSATASIRNRKFAMLRQDVQRQTNAMLMQQPRPIRAV